MPHGAAQSRYVNPTNACQSFLPHPSTFAFSGFEGAKRHRLCRPSGNPLGLNPAGVLPFRMRLTGDAGGCDVPLEWLVPHGAAQSRYYVNPTNACQSCPTHPPLLLAGSKVPNGTRRCQTAPALPTKWQPVGPESCWGSAVSDACSPATLAAVTCLWSGWRPTVLPRAVTSTQPMPAKASCPTHPPLLLAGSKVPNGASSADQVATRWA